MNQTSYRRRIDAFEKTALSELLFIYSVPVIRRGGNRFLEFTTLGVEPGFGPAGMLLPFATEPFSTLGA